MALINFIVKSGGPPDKKPELPSLNTEQTIKATLERLIKDTPWSPGSLLELSDLKFYENSLKELGKQGNQIVFGPESYVTSGAQRWTSPRKEAVGALWKALVTDLEITPTKETDIKGQKETASTSDSHRLTFHDNRITITRPETKSANPIPPTSPSPSSQSSPVAPQKPM